MIFNQDSFDRTAPRAASVLLLTLVLFLTGCGVLSRESAEEPEEQQVRLEPVEAPPHLHARPFEFDNLPLAVLVLQRQQLCLIPARERRQLLNDYRMVFVEQSAELDILPAVLPEPIHQLNALMLASCDPARTPGILSEMLAMITAGDWSADYMAFFDLMVTSHRAFVRVDERFSELADQFENLQREHQALRKQHRALQQELEATIQGISDIERGIDLPVNGAGD